MPNAIHQNICEDYSGLNSLFPNLFCYVQTREQNGSIGLYVVSRFYFFCTLIMTDTKSTLQNMQRCQRAHNNSSIIKLKLWVKMKVTAQNASGQNFPSIPFVGSERDSSIPRMCSCSCM